jgi:phosphatidylinositol-3-phosphatase
MRRALRSALALAAVGVAAAVPAPAAAAPTLPPIKHVFIIVLENKTFDETFGFYSPAPYLSLTLPSMGALLPNYYGVTHESLGNYLALISGQGSNPITQTDCQLYTPVVPGTIAANGQAIGAGCVYPAIVKTVADQLSARGLSWKAYMEDMGNAPGQSQTCRHPALLTPDPTQSAHVGDQYAARHNPFVYFDSLLGSGACARFDVPLGQLPGDLATESKTASYSFITPNLCNDGHDARCVDARAGGLVAADAFLRTWVPRITGSPAYRDGGLLAILFDEADGSDASACCAEPQFPNTTSNGLFPGRGGGHTGAVLLSPFIDPGTIDTAAYNHFSFLRSVEDVFGLGHLGYAAMSGLQSLGGDAFTCYAPAAPAIKLAVIGQGTAPRPLVEVKLWHAGTVTVKVRRRRLRPRSLGPCELTKIRLPFKHGTAIVAARVNGGVERRTLRF